MTATLDLPIVKYATAVPRWGIRTGRRPSFLRDYDEDAVVLGWRAARAVLADDILPVDAVVLGTFGGPAGSARSNARTLTTALGTDPDGVWLEEFTGLGYVENALRSATTLVQSGTSRVLVVLAHDEVDAGDRPRTAGALAMLVSTHGSLQIVESTDATTRSNEHATAAVTYTGDGRSLLVPYPQFAKSFTDSTITHPYPYGDVGALQGLLAATDADRSVTVSGRAVLTLKGDPAGVDCTPASEHEPRGHTPPTHGDETVFNPYYSVPQHWRDEADEVGLVGIQCELCATPEFPITPSCQFHGAGTTLTRVPISRTGVILTWTVDHVFPVGAPVGIGVVALDDGARFYGQVIPGDVVATNDAIELQLRRMPTGPGRPPRYFYKIAVVNRAEVEHAHQQ